MLVSELIFDLRQKFPRSPIEAWEQAYRDTLQRSEGGSLRSAYKITMASWQDPGPPKPAHIAANLPEGEKPKSFIDILAEKDLARLKRIRDRVDMLMDTAKRECAGFLCHEWSDIALMHLRNVCQRIAHMEENGVSIGAALERINASENRTGFGPRAPDVWLDEHDVAIFSGRWDSWKRVNPKADGMKRGDREPKWNLDRQPEPVRNPMAEHLAATRKKTQEMLTEMREKQEA